MEFIFKENLVGLKNSCTFATDFKREISETWWA